MMLSPALLCFPVVFLFGWLFFSSRFSGRMTSGLSLLFLISGSGLHAQTARQWYPNINHSGVEPVDGFWDDPANWVGGVVPQDGDFALIQGLASATPKNIDITYRNTYDPTATFGSIRMNTVTPSLTVDFILGNNLDVIALETSEEYTIKHSAGRLRATTMDLGGDYEMSGTATLEHLPGGTGLFIPEIGENGTFTQTNTSTAFDALILGGSYIMNGGSFICHELEVSGAFDMSSGSSQVRMVNLTDDGASLSIGSGTFDMIATQSTNRGIAVGGHLEDPDFVSPGAGAKATMHLDGNAVLTTQFPIQVGREFPGEVLHEGTAQLNSTDRVRVGFNSPGTYTLNGGSLTAESLSVGENASGEFIQNGGSVLVFPTLLVNEAFTLGTPTQNGTYRLNNGTLNVSEAFLHGDFIQTGGGFDTPGTVSMDGSYTMTAGSLDADTLLAIEGDFDFNGGALTDGGFVLKNNGDYSQAASLHHQTNGDAEFNGPNWSYTLGDNSNHTITGDSLFIGSTFQSSTLLGTNSTWAIQGKARVVGSHFTHDHGSFNWGPLEILGDSSLTQSGGNLGITGMIEVSSASQWNLNSGSVLHFGELMLGLSNNAGNSSIIHQTGGIYSGQTFDFNQKTFFRAAGGTTNFVGDGTVNGTLSIEPGGDFKVADVDVVTTGTQGAIFSQTGGVFEADAFTGGLDSHSVFEAGTAELESLTLLGNGSVGVSGGAVQLSQNAVVASGSNIAVSDGSLTVAGSTTLEGNGALSLSGGTFTTGALLLDPGVSFPTWTAGKLVINDVGSVGPTGSLGNSLSLTNNGPLQIGDSLTVQDEGSLTIGSGADLEVDQFLAFPGSTILQTDGVFSTVSDFTVFHDDDSEAELSGGVLEVGHDFTFFGNDATLSLTDEVVVNITGDFIAGGVSTILQRDTVQLSADEGFRLGVDLGEDVSYVLFSNASLSSASAVIGGQGRGQMFANGTHTVTGNLSVGSTTAEESQYRANGIVELGSVTIAGLADSQGFFRASSLTDVTGNVSVGNALNATGTMEVTTGTTTLGSLMVGGLGSGLVDQVAGNLSVTGQFHVAEGGEYRLLEGNADAGSFLNQGVFEIPANGDYPRFDAAITNEGTMEIRDDWRSDELFLIHSNDGIVTLHDGSSWDFSSNNQLTNGVGGVIRGEGSLGGTSFAFHNEGTIQPGSSPGNLTLRTNMTSASTAVMEFEIEGPLASERDQLTITGRCGLGGKLVVNFNGYTPELNDEFVLIDASIELTGSFDTVEVTGLPSPLDAVPKIVGNDLVLEILEVLLPPTGLKVALQTSSTLPVSWTDTNSGAAGYRARFAIRPEGSWIIGTELPTGATQGTLTGLTSGATYDIQVQAVMGGRQSEWSETITANTVPASLAAWRQTHFGTETDSGDAANSATPLNDGIPNLIKYTLGLNPLSDSNGHVRLPEISQMDIEVKGETAQYLTYSFIIPDPLPDGVSLEVTTSTDLKIWSTNAVLVENDTTTVPDESHQIWRTPLPIGVEDEYFLRLEAE